MKTHDQMHIKQIRENIITALKQCEADAIAGHRKDFQMDWEYTQRKMSEFLKLAFTNLE